ncbi:MAG TPA: CRISPR-associated helicase Cas3' [Accumulibacter sp.]|uniref:CRISPR-associated helicase Cas3' n=1 Tax=Accumulibacter sp. TaxID=2053492 RepID=UPI002C2EA651|nr:CRISPR-associated helicase Cas3' [Accumulibacter sp.]HMV06914.1 CRISPR-associated helicase Cas3' [Accumulibacter sp.]HNL98706.1 CRISPR-associated helicase Cas3' [Accumulibacter sp.]
MLAWGKLLLDGEGAVVDRLSLTDHCIDVASVFRELCDLPAIRRNLDHEAGRPLSGIHLDRLAVFALLHDIGKCNHGFQAKEDARAHSVAGHVREVAALLADEDLRQQTVAALRLEDMLCWFRDPQTDLLRMLVASVSHHGQPAFVWDALDGLAAARDATFWRKKDAYDPFVALARLGRAAHEAFPLAFDGQAEALELTPALEHRFAGLLMLADWLGSHREAFFPFHQAGSRIPWARRQARRALSAVGLDIDQARQSLANGLPSFAQVFDLAAEPKPLQSALARADLPPLLIAESDTGSGKTEAALLHFLALFAAGEVDGLYFALPTRVAAREIYGRVESAMRRTFGERCPPVLLAVPGYAQVDGEPAGMLPAHGQLWHEADQARRERAWCAERPKRFLAAAVAVGTIDQALFSGIQVPHAHLRAACLDRSLLVIDEVHSSDTYMCYLSRRVLARHLAAGGRALLLSATLGSAARAKYLSPAQRPSGMDDFATAVGQPYPALCAPGSALRRLPDPDARAKRVRIRALGTMDQPEALLPGLRSAILAGRRVMVVLNTVARAIALTRLADADPLLRAALFAVNGQACPHHGRFARADRELLDKTVSRCLGKGSPAGAVLLIGTQTLEQSLDLDADWLITDLCPIDVLLQRIGRLHRHDRGPRPEAECSVLLPEEPELSSLLRNDGEVGRGGMAGLGFVYEDLRILQLTRDWAVGEPPIEIPRDNRFLVESATHPERLATLTAPKWKAHADRLEGREYAQASAADSALIPDKPFGDFRFPHGLEANLSTRLGLNDRTLRLGGLHGSPFGLDIDEINLPGHLAGGLTAEEAHAVRSWQDTLLIDVGSLHFRYSRFGLEKLDESAP